MLIHTSRSDVGPVLMSLQRQSWTSGKAYKAITKGKKLYIFALVKKAKLCTLHILFWMQQLIEYMSRAWVLLHAAIYEV